MHFNKIIRDYFDEIEEIANGNELSPFETHFVFHTRSELHKHSLTDKEKIELAKADLLLIQNVEKVYRHLSEIYDFEQSKQPLDEWWWHLDKVISGEIRFESVKTIQKSVGKPARYSPGFEEVDLLGAKKDDEM
jgi:hypothetical protein